VVARLGVIDRATLADVSRHVAATTAHAIGFVLTGIERPSDYGYGSGPQIPVATGSSVLKPTLAEGEAAGRRQRALP
jgi:hypothetical protein